MKLVVLAMVITCLTLNVNCQELEHHQWKHRLLLLISTGKGEQENLRQLKWLRSNLAGLDERKLLVYQLRSGYFLKGLDSSIKEKKQAKKLYDNYASKDEDFEVILIGLDGYEKFRSNHPVEIKSIFERIDAMPMRRNEIRNSRQNQN